MFKNTFLKSLVFVLFAVLFFGIKGEVSATSLAPWDIFVVTVNSNPDTVEFVSRVNMITGTKIYLSDDARTSTGTWRNTEWYITFISSVLIPRGTIIRLTWLELASQFVFPSWAWTVTKNGSFDLSTAWENILMYQWTTYNQVSPSFLYWLWFWYGITWISSWTPTSNNSYLPSPLNFGQSAISLSSNRNVQYNCSNTALLDPSFVTAIHSVSNRNSGTVAYTWSTCVFDFINPSLSINLATWQSLLTSWHLVKFFVSASEALNTGSFTCADIILSGSFVGSSTCNNIVQVSPFDRTKFEVTVLATGNGVINMNILSWTVQDVAWNSNSPSTVISNTITIDQTKPIITLISGNITLAIWSPFIDPGATWIDNIDWSWMILTATSGTVNTAIIGAYILQYTYTDTAGNTGNTVTRTVNVTDQTSPLVTLSWSTPITIAQGWTYTEEWATRTDNIDWSWTILTPTSGTVDTNTVGTYILEYTYTDIAGNTGNTVTRTVNVTDQTAPETTIITGTLSGTLSATGNHNFAFISSETGTFECRINSWMWSVCTSPIDYIWLMDGMHIFEVRAIDVVSNQDPSPAASTFTIDTTPPTSPILHINIDSPYSVNTPEITFNGSADIHFSGYMISLDDGPFMDVSNPYYPSLTWVTHKIMLRAYDTVGNYSQVIAYYPPVVNIIAPTILSNTGITDTTIQITSASGDIITNVIFSWVDNTWFDCWILPASVPLTCTGWSINTGWIFTVIAMNGSFTGSTTQSYIIDIVPPMSTLSFADVYVEPSNRTSFDINLTFDSIVTWILNTGSFTVSNGQVTSLTKINDTEYILTLSVTQDGLLEIQLLSWAVYDIANNWNIISNNLTIIVDTTPPLVTLSWSTAITLTLGDSYTEEWATRTDNTDWSWTILTPTSGTVNTNQPWTYTLEYTYTDTAGNTGNTVTRTVIVNNPWIPDPQDDFFTGNQDTDIDVSAGQHISNDNNLSSVVSWYASIEPLHGTYILSWNGFIYTPNPWFAWIDTLEYSLCNVLNECGTAIITFTIIDTQSPLITLSWSTPITIAQWSIFTDNGATRTDNGDGSGIILIATSGTVNTAIVGTYILEYTYTDMAGNTGNVVMRAVNVISGSVPSTGSATPSTPNGSTYNPNAGSINNNPNTNTETGSTENPTPATAVDMSIFNTDIDTNTCFVPMNQLTVDQGNNVSALFKIAHQMLYSYGLTTIVGTKDFVPTRQITRAEAAKFFVQFAQNVLCKKTIQTYDNRFVDIAGIHPDLQANIKLSYEYGIFYGSEGGAFNPNAYISHDELVAVIIRLVTGKYDDVAGTDRAANYINTLETHTSIDLTNTTRGKLAEVLYDLYKNNNYSLQSSGYVMD
jgi:hypothetical protein